MEQTAKKQWQKPELIVLVRNKPEEAVLSGCKGNGGGGDPEYYALGCAYDGCFPCQAWDAS